MSEVDGSAYVYMTLQSACHVVCCVCVCVCALCAYVIRVEMSTAHVLRDAQSGEHQAMKARMEAALRECEQAREVRRMQGMPSLALHA